ncbi:MAG TPA: polyphosphate:AMP phosphotransferase, partial [Candidatus Methylomirabilis sp.]
MFETAELGVSVDKEAYKREVPSLREGLLAAQKELAASNLAVVVVIGGVEGAGKAETVNQLLEWVDARGVETHAMGVPTDEERERPPMWRFWRLLPARGRMGIFLGSWYTDPIVQRAIGDMGDAPFGQALERVVEFERMLIREGVVVVKFWL